MSKESFDAVAGDFKTKKPTVESLDLGAYDFGADDDNPSEVKHLSLEQVRQKQFAKMEAVS
jgi:hypothetical protein